MITSANCEEITEDSLLVTVSEGERQRIPTDSVILAVGYKQNDALLRAIEGKFNNVYCIGDAVSPQRIREAISAGYRTGLSV